MKFGLRNRNPTSSWPRVVRRAGAAAVLVEAAGEKASGGSAKAVCSLYSYSYLLIDETYSHGMGSIL